jgi:hypothetical protein
LPCFRFAHRRQRDRLRLLGDFFDREIEERLARLRIPERRAVANDYAFAIRGDAHSGD